MAKSTRKSNDEVVISLDQFAIPGAIVLAGLIIAGAIFLSNRGGDTQRDSVDLPTDQFGEEFQDGTLNLGSDFIYSGDINSAQVAIVEFSEYLCGFCQRHAEQTYDLLIENYVETGQAIYVYKKFPMYGEQSDNLAMGGKCVFEKAGLDKFIDYHLGAFMLEGIDDIEDLVNSIGLDGSEIIECIDSGKYEDSIRADMSSGQNAGVQGTPGFLIGFIDDDGNVTGQLIAGAYPYEEFASVLDSLLD